MGLDNLGDGCLIRIETDAGIVGYGEAGLPSAAARTRIEMMAPQLIGQDPLAIERHFYMMAATQYSFMANIPTVSGVDIALWDLAGKIIGYSIYRLLGGPIRKNIPVYSHGGPADMLDKAQCKTWADQVKSAPEGFTAFKFGFGAPGGWRAGRARRGWTSERPVHSDAGRRGIPPDGKRLCQSTRSTRRQHRHCHALHWPVRYP
jgi:L-alanine-DL-glutamate epimerase-like enolase superfamily enzyme